MNIRSCLTVSDGEKIKHYKVHYTTLSIVLLGRFVFFFLSGHVINL